MITTLDNVVCKRGDKVWEIGITIKGKYAPTTSTVHGRSNGVVNPDKCWKDYQLCKDECNKLNKQAY